MTKQADYQSRLKSLNKARIDFDHTVQHVADKIGLSRRRLYQILKYPNENLEKYRDLCEYVNSAGYDFEDSLQEKVSTANEGYSTQKSVSH